MKNLIRYVLTLCLAFSMVSSLIAQELPIDIANISDQQLIQLINKYQLNGLSEAQLEAAAKQKGLSPDQIMLLKRRMAEVDPLSNKSIPSIKSKTTDENSTDRNKIEITPPAATIKPIVLIPKLKVFGSELFENTGLSFEPNINIATPKNYIIGVGDEIIVDIYGLSESTKKLKVSTEGFIRFPNLGPIKVAGLTIEDAQVKIKNEASKVYTTIVGGDTKVSISLGQMRSIRVTLIGEVNKPGSYSVSALSTIMNALYASGGPNAIGSFRKIELVRSGKPIVQFDLYDFLLKGDLIKNKLLQDEDVIRVGAYESRVAVTGSSKKQALFDIKKGETALDLLTFAGGFADEGYKEMIRIKRLGTKGKEVVTVKAENLKNFNLMSGDTLVVDALATNYDNIVIGQDALSNSAGNPRFNTVFGNGAGANSPGGVYGLEGNVFIGRGAGAGTQGNSNVILGNVAGGAFSNNIILADGDGTIRYQWDGTTNNFNTGSITAASFKKSGGTSSQYLMADGSTSTGGGVTSFSGGTTGLTPSTATSGVVTLAGTLVAANGGTGQSTYATGDILYASATNTLSKLTKGSDGQVLIAGSTGIPYWGSNGLSTLNNQTATSHSFAISSSTTTALSWSSASSGTPLVATHTLVIPDATASLRGFISTGSQSFAGDKTFSNDLSANGIYIGRGTNSRTSNLAIGSSANTSGKNFSTVSTTAINNIAIGVTTLSSLIDGYKNNAVGNGALSSTNSGYQNNAFGYEALKGNTSGYYNSGFGESALLANSTGNNNTAVGYNSLVSTTGSQNTAIGSTSNVAAARSNSTAIGFGASVSDNNTIQLGNTSVTDVKTSGKITASSFVVNGGTATQVLMANGSYGTMPAAHYIGESYGGGIVFYVYDNGQHGLIAATTNQSNGVIWGVSSTIRTFGDGIGAGRNNTAVIASYSNSNSDNAASVCMNYSVTVDNVRYADWYLPSYHELTLLFNQKSLSGLNMSIGEWWYWSSTEMTNIGAWTVKFKDGYTNNQTQKNNAGVLVRAIRHF